MFVAPSGASNVTGTAGGASSELSATSLHRPCKTRPLSTRFPRSATISSRTRLPHCVRQPSSPAGAQQNAQRNLAPVASAADASTCDVTFGLVAPSGTIYSTGPATGCLPHLSTSFALRRPIPRRLSTAHPRPGPRDGSVVHVVPVSTTGRPRASTSTGSASAIRQR